MLVPASPLRQRRISTETGTALSELHIASIYRDLIGAASSYSYLSVLRWVAVAKSAGHYQHQRFMLQIHYIIFIHGHDLEKPKNMQIAEGVSSLHSFKDGVIITLLDTHSSQMT